MKERQDSVGVPPGESRTVTFAAGAPGTYAYYARLGNIDYDQGEREQLSGAFIVDSANATPNDRVFVMNIWSHSDSASYRNVLAINGKSFPYTEGMTATTGDTVRWRWLNGTVRPHPMHMHGFYFTINARGSFRTDTAYETQQRRTVVTELMEPFTTMAMSWVPDRDGRWLFHCHISFHSVSSDARLDPPAGDHAMMSEDPGQHMAGLVLGIDVKAAEGWTPAPRPSPRTLRMFVIEGTKLGRSDRSMGYAIEHGSESPSAPLTRVGGPPLVLTRGQPDRHHRDQPAQGADGGALAWSRTRELLGRRVGLERRRRENWRRASRRRIPSSPASACHAPAHSSITRISTTRCN